MSESNSKPLDGPRQRPLTLTISMDGLRPTVDQDPARAKPGRVVFWAADSDRRWVVAINGTESPFSNGRMVWEGHGKGVDFGGPLREDLAAGQEFKYMLLYQDEDYVWQAVDPVIVIEDPEDN